MPKLQADVITSRAEKAASEATLERLLQLWLPDDDGTIRDGIEIPEPDLLIVRDECKVPVAAGYLALSPHSAELGSLFGDPAMLADSFKAAALHLVIGNRKTDRRLESATISVIYAAKHEVRGLHQLGFEYAVDQPEKMVRYRHAS